MRVDVYSRHDAYLGTIAPDELLSFVWTDELNGEDSVAIQTTYHLKEGYRLVWADSQGNAHEHICQDPKGLHEGGSTIYSDTALNSICELFGDYIEDKRPYSYSFYKALGVCLAPTRWGIGTVDQTGTVSSGLTFYHTSCREALNDILECGGEMETSIEVGGSGVESRKVGIRMHRGSTGGHRRFAYGKDVSNVSKTEHWGAITACYGYGKGVETDSGGYGRKLTFGDINDDKDYVEDTDALKTYGRPDGSGGFAHVFGTYENSECEDASQLLEETQAYLDEHKEPGVTYEANVVDLVQFGRDWEGVGVGDDVQLVDSEYDPELRCTGRVSKLVTDMLSGAQEVTLGNVTETLADMWMTQQQAVSSLSKRSSNWDVAAYTPGAYLQQIIDGLNEQFNTQGMSYCFTSFELGTIWSSVPLDENGKPTKSGGSAIQICSQGFRIASGTTDDGYYDWRTFGTGEGFTADVINAGTITGGSNYWNLDTGDLLFKQGTIQSVDESGDPDDRVCINITTGEVKLSAYSTTKYVDGEVAELTSTIESTAENLTATFNSTLTNYSTTEQMNSAIKLSAENLTATFNKTLTNYSTTEKMNSAISASAENLTATFNKTLTNYSTTEQMKSAISATAEEISLSVEGSKIHYCTCTTAAATQTKVCTNEDFENYTGATVCVRFSNLNSAASPKLTVQNASSGATETATGYIYVNGSKMTEDYWWAAGDVLTLVWTGSAWQVADGYTRSAIEVLRNSISLSVTSGTGGKASIVLSVDGEEETASTGLVTSARTAFASEDTSITISAGVITFNSNTFVVNSTNFSVTKTGVITATSGTIGGFTITSSAIYNDEVRFDKNGISIYYNSTVVGEIGEGSWAQDTTKRGIVFHLDPGGSYMAWGEMSSSSDDAYDALFFYNRPALTSTSGYTYQADTVHFGKKVHFHNNVGMNNFRINSVYFGDDSGLANGLGNSGEGTTLRFSQIWNCAKDGTFTYVNNCYLTFKYGFVIAGSFNTKDAT